MKLFLLALCISVLVALGQADTKEEANNRVEQILKECKEEINPTKEDLESLKTGTLTPNAKCLVTCTLTKGKFLKDGVYQKEYVHDRIRKFADKDIDNIDKVFEDLAKCEDKVTSTEKCEIGAEFHACLKNIYHIKW